MMKNWVTPSMAAELWGLPVDAVLASIEEGRLIAKVDGGFTFVQIDTDAAFQGRPHSDHPKTYAVVTDAELEALHEDESVIEEETSAISVEDWRGARERTAKLRKGPNLRSLNAA